MTRILLIYTALINTRRQSRFTVDERRAPKEIDQENKEESVGRDRNGVDERVAEIISGRHREGRAEGRGQEAAWGVLWS